MSGLSPEKAREVIRKLAALGFEGPSGGGKHLVMRHPLTRKKITVPVHGSTDIPVGTLRAIVREAGITPEDWNNLYGKLPRVAMLSLSRVSRVGKEGVACLATGIFPVLDGRCRTS